MKKATYFPAVLMFIVGTILSACNSSTEKVENEKNNITEAKQDLNQAQEEYNDDVQEFKKETNDKIAGNEKTIAELNTRIAKEKKGAKADYKNKIANLEQRNADMKKKMDEYKEEGKDKWKSFKVEFNNEMDDLGKSIKDLMTSNK